MACLILQTGRAIWRRRHISHNLILAANGDWESGCNYPRALLSFRLLTVSLAAVLSPGVCFVTEISKSSSWWRRINFFFSRSSNSELEDIKREELSKRRQKFRKLSLPLPDFPILKPVSRLVDWFPLSESIVLLLTAFLLFRRLQIGINRNGSKIERMEGNNSARHENWEEKQGYPW